MYLCVSKNYLLVHKGCKYSKRIKRNRSVPHRNLPCSSNWFRQSFNMNTCGKKYPLLLFWSVPSLLNGELRECLGQTVPFPICTYTCIKGLIIEHSRLSQPLYFLTHVMEKQCPPPTPSNLPFCSGVQFSHDSTCTFNDQMQIRGNRGLWTVYIVQPKQKGVWSKDHDNHWEDQSNGLLLLIFFFTQIAMESKIIYQY